MAFKRVLIALLITLMQPIVSQNDWIELSSKVAFHKLDSINVIYRTKVNGKFSSSYKTYKDHTTTDLYQEHKGYVIRKNGKYCNTMLGRTVIQDDKYRLVIDSNTHKIKFALAFQDQDVSFDPSSLTRIVSNGTRIFYSEEYKGFRFLFPNKVGLIKQEVFLSPESVSKIILYYKHIQTTRSNTDHNKETFYPRVCIDITNFDLDNNIPESVFATDTYVTIKKGKIATTERFKSFKLIDGRISK